MERYTPYRAYLVPIWSTGRRGLEDHRAAAENVATGDRKNFADLESLFAFLETPTDDRSDRNREDAPDGRDRISSV